MITGTRKIKINKINGNMNFKKYISLLRDKVPDDLIDFGVNIGKWFLFRTMPVVTPQKRQQIS